MEYDCDESTKLKAKDIVDYVLMEAGKSVKDDFTKKEYNNIITEVCIMLEND